MANYVTEIYTTFHNLPNSHVLIIKGSEELGYTFAASESYDEAIGIRTQQLFKQIFDEFPIQEILSQCSTPILSKEVIRQIFVKMAVFSDRGPPLNFSSFEDSLHIFLDSPPNVETFYIDKADTCGKGFEGLCEKVYLQWQHYFSTQRENDPIKVEIRQAEFLTSRMGNREFQEGAYVYLGKKEIFQVAKVIVKEGAYVSILRDISNPTKVKIVCRGTAMNPKATEAINSGLNDFHYEMGNGGVQATWPTLSAYLTQQKIKEVEIYGKSLGGGHGQRFAILIIKEHPTCLLTELITVCSSGAGEETELLFNNLIIENERYHTLKVSVIRNGGKSLDEEIDYIPCVGGDHIGSTVDAKYLDLHLYYIHPTAEKIFSPKDNLSVIETGFKFLASFTDAHNRQTTLADFSYRHFDNREDIQAELKLGIILEPTRKRTAYKKEISFSDYVNSPLLRDASKSNENAQSSLDQDTSIGKIVTMSSSIFLVLSLAGFVTCFVLHPGTVIYEGHGIILTLPTIIMAGTAGLSMVTLAIGSYYWWVSSKDESPIEIVS